MIVIILGVLILNGVRDVLHHQDFAGLEVIDESQKFDLVILRVTNKKRQALLVGACLFFCDSVEIYPL